MKKIIAGLFALALVAGFARADVGAPAPTAKDLEKVVEEVNYVETAKSGIVLSGYVDVGYIYNLNSTNARHRTRTDAGAQGDFDVNAVKLTLEKPLTAANEFQAGFRVDLMLGEDVASIGGQNGGAPLNGAAAGVNNESSDSFFMEQAYVTFRTPVGNGIDWKVGKFVTWLGYEVIERPSNLNITYGNMFQNLIPLWHTGISAEYAFNDIVDGGIAITNGANQDDNFYVSRGGSDTEESDGYGIMAKLNFTNPGGNANWYHSVYYGFGGNDAATAAGGVVPAGSGVTFDNETTFVYDTWGNWAPKFADYKLLLGFNANIGFGEGIAYNQAGVGGTQVEENTTNWGAALYAKYQFTDVFSLAGRADYIHSDDGSRWNPNFVAGNNNNSGNRIEDTDVWSWTMTAGFDLLENFLVRAEYRLDWGSDLNGAATAAGGETVEGPDHQVTLQAVYTF